MKLNAWVAAMERIAPPELALEGDNIGLLVGLDKDAISKVLVALDCTAAVVHEAVDQQADLVLTHHPLFFRSVNRLLFEKPDTAAACFLLRNGIGHYAAHTNLDAAVGGVNDVLAHLLNVQDMVPFGDGVGRIGKLPFPETLEILARRVGASLGTTIRMVGNIASTVQTVALTGGSGGMDLISAKAANADVFITGELKHHEALEALTLGLHCVVAGHFETERIVLRPLIKRLQKETPDVQYMLAQADIGPFVTVQEDWT